LLDFRHSDWFQVDVLSACASNVQKHRPGQIYKHLKLNKKIDWLFLFSHRHVKKADSQVALLRVENGFSQNHEIQTIKPVFAGDRTEVAASFSIRSEVGGDETSTVAENCVDFDASSREML